VTEPALEQVERPVSDVLAEVVAWCRATAVDPLPESAVPGPNERELRHLAALGGLAAAMADLAGEGKEGASSSMDRWPSSVALWAKSAPPIPPRILQKVRFALESDEDLLAMCYQQLVSARRRRRLGTFFTPPPVVEYMIDIGRRLQAAPANIIDPGAGVGAFTLAALNAWPSTPTGVRDLHGLLACRW
jgi:adenine-specific DNA-methyltransferase